LATSHTSSFFTQSRTFAFSLEGSASDMLVSVSELSPILVLWAIGGGHLSTSPGTPRRSF
jgi:hypothetical protein